MDEREGELSEVPGHGTALNSDDLVYIRLASDPTTVHRAASNGGLAPRTQRVRCGIIANMERVSWTAEPPNCVVCLGTEDREPLHEGSPPYCPASCPTCHPQ